MIREGFPEFEVSVGVDFGNPFVASMVLALKCTRCGETHFVFQDPWLAGEHISGSTKTRSCPYCMRTSRPPNEEDGVETDPKQEFMEEPTSEARGFTEDPEDDEHVEVPSEEDEEGDDEAGEER